MASKLCATEAVSDAAGDVSSVVVVAGRLPSPLSRALSFRFFMKSMAGNKARLSVLRDGRVRG